MKAAVYRLITRPRIDGGVRACSQAMTRTFRKPTPMPIPAPMTMATQTLGARPTSAWATPMTVAISRITSPRRGT